MSSYSEEKKTTCYESEDSFWAIENRRLVENEANLLKQIRLLRSKLLFYENAYQNRADIFTQTNETKTSEIETQTIDTETQIDTATHTVQPILSLKNVSFI